MITQKNGLKKSKKSITRKQKIWQVVFWMEFYYWTNQKIGSTYLREEGTWQLHLVMILAPHWKHWVHNVIVIVKKDPPFHHVVRMVCE
jgi:hypothetical protein